MVLLTLLCVACGQVYRPVVTPCAGQVPNCPVETPPSPANFHAVFAISTNAPGYPGGAMQIDVSGDSIIGETPTSDLDAPNLGDIPTHAAIIPNDTRVFVASASSVLSGGFDVVSSFSPAFQSSIGSGLGAVTAVGLPSQTSNLATISEAGNLVTVALNVPLTNLAAGYAIVIAGIGNPLAYNGTFTIVSISGTTLQCVNPTAGLPQLSGAQLSGATASVPSQPVFLNSTQNNAMYVANFNSNSVSAINTSSNFVSNSATVGANPVSLAETPNGLKLYVANQGDNTVSSLNVADLSSNPVTGFSGKTPVWVVARADSQKVYVLTQGDGQLVTLDTATDTVTSSLPVGAGANFIFFDPNLNRLYVTNPVTGTVYVFSDTGGANDTPIQLAAISMTAGANPPCPSGCSPASVTALPDGSRFYVASYQIATPCPDPTVTVSPCVIPGLTVFDANSLTPKITPALTLLAWSPAGTTPGPFAPNQYALPPVTSCASPVLPFLYKPGVTRFRVFTTAAADSSNVYVSMCDAGAVAVIDTTDGNTNNTSGGGTPADSLVTDLPAAFSAGAPQSNGEPPNQNPIFMLTGQ
jgi:YVTN family beta-propeller protein